MIDAIKEICYPPYGANIASAGLFLGVYVAPRYEKLVVMKDGEQLGISQWIQEGIFRGKFVKLALLYGVDLMQIGEASSEWETLLDEWEQCSNHLSRRSSLERALDLKKRSPVPPMLVYREERLQEQAVISFEAIQKVEKEQDEALKKIEHGSIKRAISLLSRGVADLKKLCDKMLEEQPLWTELQISEMQPELENGRQEIIYYFPDWIVEQTPKSDAPSDVGDFKHKMIRLMGSNLKKLGLETEYQQLESHTKRVVKNVEFIAEARQLLRNVRSWLLEHADVKRVGRIVEIRGLKEVGSEYSKKLQGIAQRTQLSEVAEVRAQLSDFRQNIKQAEEGLVNRASVLWDTKIRTETDIDRVLAEVNSLIIAFENLSNDLEDLQLMQKALKIYMRYYQRLSAEHLNWDSFYRIADDMRKECTDVFEEEEVPWPLDEVINAFVKDISVKREERSLAWITRIKKETSSVSSMPAAAANRLHAQLSHPPVVITEKHTQMLNEIIHLVNQRLNELNIEWLVEKFKELSGTNKIEFIHIAQRILGQV